MEPRLPAPNSPEAGAYNPQELPRSPEFVAQPRAEQAPERPAPQEVQQAGPIQSGPALPPPTPAPAQAPQQQVVPVLNPMAAHDGNPVSANDEEVIEKEWVDRAKQIVQQTKADPYKQEQEVSKLQADYLKKRYGKEVKVTND